MISSDLEVTHQASDKWCGVRSENTSMCRSPTNYVRTLLFHFKDLLNFPCQDLLNSLIWNRIWWELVKWLGYRYKNFRQKIKLITWVFMSKEMILCFGFFVCLDLCQKKWSYVRLEGFQNHIPSLQIGPSHKQYRECSFCVFKYQMFS